MQLAPGAIVSDVGSVKGAIVCDMSSHCRPGILFVPRASGRRNRTFRSGRRLCPTLFVGRWCILTPPESIPTAHAVRTACRLPAGTRRRMSRRCGRDPPRPCVGDHQPPAPPLSPTRSSAPPTSSPRATRSEVLKFSAGGFPDFTRIAASDPTMWRDVFLANKEAAPEMLRTFNEESRATDPRDAAATARHCLPISPAPARSAAASRYRRGFRPLPSRSAGPCCRGPTPSRTTIECSVSGPRFYDKPVPARNVASANGLAEHVVDDRLMGAFALSRRTRSSANVMEEVARHCDRRRPRDFPQI